MNKVFVILDNSNTIEFSKILERIAIDYYHINNKLRDIKNLLFKRFVEHVYRELLIDEYFNNSVNDKQYVLKRTNSEIYISKDVVCAFLSIIFDYKLLISRIKRKG